MAVTSATSAPTVSVEQTGFNGLTADDFLKLLIAQLRNQDPSEPVTNSELLGQLSTMRGLQADIELSSTLKELAGSLNGDGDRSFGQQLSLGASYLGRSVTFDDGSIGTVDSAFVVNGEAVLGIGGQEFPLTNVVSVNTPDAFFNRRVAFESTTLDELGNPVIAVGEVTGIGTDDGMPVVEIMPSRGAAGDEVIVPLDSIRRLVTSESLVGRNVTAISVRGNTLSGLASAGQHLSGRPAITVGDEVVTLDRVTSIL